MGAEEDGAGVLDPLCQSLRILHQQLQVLRREPITEAGRLHQVCAHHDQAPVSQGLAHDRRPGVPGELGRHRRRHRRRQLFTGGDQNGCRQRIVLRLGHQVGGHLVGPGGVVGDHQHLAGARQGIDPHLAVHSLLGQGHPEVARPADHIHPGNGGGAVGQSGDRLGPADPIHLPHPGEMGGRQHRGVGLPIRARRRDHHDPRHAGHTGRHGVHQHRARIRSPTAGHVEACPRHGPPAAPEPLAMGSAHRQVGGKLVTMKGRDPVVGQLQGGTQGGRRGLPSLGQALGRNGEGIGPHPVETLGEIEQGLVTLEAHPLQDRGHALLLLCHRTSLGPLGDGRQPGASQLRIPQAGQSQGRVEGLQARPLLRWVHFVHKRIQQWIPRPIQEPDPGWGRNADKARAGWAPRWRAAPPQAARREACWQGRIFVCRVSASTCGQ